MRGQSFCHANPPNGCLIPVLFISVRGAKAWIQVSIEYYTKRTANSLRSITDNSLLNLRRENVYVAMGFPLAPLSRTSRDAIAQII